VWYHAAMSFRSYLFLMALCTLLAWIAWVLIMLNVNPEEAGAGGFILFYITLTTGLIGSLSLAGILYRVVLRNRKDVVIREVKTSFRHAVLLSLVAILALILSAQGKLHWWVLVVLIIVASVIEYVSLMLHGARRG